MLRFGLFGSAGSGKDALYEAMERLSPGLQRVAFGDAVKASAAPALAAMGIDIATMTRQQKDQVRPMLEQLGDDLWDRDGAAWLQTLPQNCVNTRIQRPAEAVAWLDVGGTLVEVIRCEPATEREERYIAGMRQLRHQTVYNTGSLDDLESVARWLLGSDPRDLGQTQEAS